MNRRAMKEVTLDDFKAWVNAYPRPLDFDAAQMCDPPYCSYNDFSLGKWPESVVASYHGARGPGEPAYGFRILEAIPCTASPSLRHP